MIEYINAFDILSSRRQCGMTVNPISMSDIFAYLKIFGSTDAEVFVKHIITMDAVFLAHINKSEGPK